MSNLVRCNNTKCPLKDQCRRHVTKDEGQRVADFRFYISLENGYQCDNLLSIFEEE